MLRILLATAAAVGLAVPHAAEAAFFVEDFGTFTPTTDLSPQPVAILGGRGEVSRGDGNNQPLGIFDTTGTSGPDGDLRPGSSSTFGNALILDQDGSGLPDDDQDGGIFNFEFFGSGLGLHEMTFLDIEINETIRFYDGFGGDDGSNTLLASIAGTASPTQSTSFDPNAVVTIDFSAGTADNATVVGTFDTAVFANLTTWSIDLTEGGTSTAIAEISAVPLPGAVVLFASGAALVGYVSRRSRRREVATAA
mgnify:FL=1